MLSKEIFKEQINRLVDIYPTWKIEYAQPRVMKNWYDRFKTLHDIQFTKMVDKYIDTERSVPTVAGLLSCKEEYYAPLTPEERERARKSIEAQLLEPKSMLIGGEDDIE